METACDWCDNCSENEVYIGGVIGERQVADGLPEGCHSYAQGCAELLVCDAEEEDVEEDADLLTEIDRLLVLGDMEGLRTKLRTQPERIRLVPDRRVLLVWGESCSGEVQMQALRNISGLQTQMLLSQE